MFYSRYPSQKDEVAYDFESAKDRIIGLKNHLVRTMAQEKCKEDILSNLTSSQALLTMDWAMKYLPRRFREAQQHFSFTHRYTTKIRNTLS
jgi:hypothetical protein